MAFIKNFVNNRKFRIKANGLLSLTMDLENKIPKGSVLSPTLFIMAINDLLEGSQSPLKGRLYADDLVIFRKSNNTETFFAITQNYFYNLENWFQFFT